MVDINETIYTIKGQPYFKVYVKSHGRVIKQFTQAAGGNETAEAIFLICKDLKCAWFKPFTPIIDGLKFITYVDLSNAIPLKFEKETKFVDTDFVTKEIEIITISEDEEKQSKNKKDGMPDKLVEINLMPELLFEIIDANFVTKILTPPPDKYDFLKGKWGIIIIAGIAIWYFLNGGKLL